MAGGLTMDGVQAERHVGRRASDWTRPPANSLAQALQLAGGRQAELRAARARITPGWG